MTLDGMLQECAVLTYNTEIMMRTSGGYVDEGLTYARRFLSGINYILRKISREKYAPTLTEVVSLNADGAFDAMTLAHTYLRIRSIKQGDVELAFTIDDTEYVRVQNATGDVTVIYDYLPADFTLSDLDVECPLPPRVVDPMILVWYACIQFLKTDSTDYDRARVDDWLVLFNDGFDNIVRPTRQTQVKAVV